MTRWRAYLTTPHINVYHYHVHIKKNLLFSNFLPSVQGHWPFSCALQWCSLCRGCHTARARGRWGSSRAGCARSHMAPQCLASRWEWGLAWGCPRSSGWWGLRWLMAQWRSLQADKSIINYQLSMITAAPAEQGFYPFPSVWAPSTTCTFLSVILTLLKTLVLSFSTAAQRSSKAEFCLTCLHRAGCWGGGAWDGDLKRTQEAADGQTDLLVVLGEVLQERGKAAQAPGHLHLGPKCLLFFCKLRLQLLPPSHLPPYTSPGE